MDTLISDRTRKVGQVEEHLTVEAPASPDGSLDIDLQYVDPTSVKSGILARSFVTLPWEVATEIAEAVQARQKEFAQY